MNLKQRLFLIEMDTKPTYPIIVEIQGVLYPIENEDMFWRKIHPNMIQLNMFYMAIDSRGLSWQFRQEEGFQVRFLLNTSTTRITKQMFVNGFNIRKNNPDNQQLIVKVTHKKFSEIFQEAYSILINQN